MRRGVTIAITILLSARLHSYCQDDGQIRNGGLICLSGKDLSLDEIKQRIKDQTGINIGFNVEVGRAAQLYKLDLHNVGIDSCLRVMVAGKWLEYKKVNSTTYVILSKEGMDPGGHMLAGMVANREGEPLVKATVRDVRNGRTVLTDEEGRFILPGGKGPAVAEVSFTDYFPYRAAVSEGRPLNIVLEHNVHSLDGVVVEAYGHTTHRLETGDIAQLKSSDIEKQPVGNLLAALEGRLPGLVVTQSSGVPGGSSNIQVRGQNSILQGNQPLIVIDGVPIPANNHSLSVIPSGSAYGLPGRSPMDCFNPADIESIEVLKDADATAIYGSRGANGVLLITTKKGKAGPMIIGAGLSFGGSRPVNLPHLLNSEQYVQMREEAIHNDGLNVDSVTAPDLLLGTNRYTDYKKMAVGNRALFQDGWVRVSGGDTIFNYLLSGGEHRESTPFPGSHGERRLSVFASLGYHSRNKRLQIQGSTFYSTVDNRLPLYDPTQFIYLAPNTPSPYDPAGNFVWQSNGVSFLNIPAQRLDVYHGFTKNMFTHWELVYHLLPGLSARASVGYNSIRTSETGIIPIASQPMDSVNPPTGSYFGGATDFNGLIGEPQLEYIREKGIAKLDLLAGVTWEQQHSNQHAVTVFGYSNDSQLGTPDPTLPAYTQDSSVLYLYEAMTLRAKLELADKYIFTVNGRRDGSSRFGPSHQFGNFWSVGAAWLFQKEKFFPDLPFLSYGKLRGSYGVTGNDQIGDYQYAQSWNISTTAPYGGVQGVYPATPGNNLLAWELVHKLEGALELGAWQDRLFFSAAWYRDWSGNQLLYKLLPLQTGYQAVTANLPAVVENKGWELVFRSQQKLSRYSSWNSSFSLTIPTNRLVSFPGLAGSGYASQLATGKSLSTINAFQYEGVDRDSGIYRFRDVNHDGHIDGNDRVFGGNSDLRVYGGWNNEINYKGWQVTIFVEARKQNGYDALVQLFKQSPLGTATSPGMLRPGLLSNEPVEALLRWQHPGDNQPLQAFTATPGSAAANALNQYVFSGALLRDASFIRVKTVMLSYNLPGALLSKWHLRSCLLYLQAQNLLTFSRYPVTDPETQNPNVLPPLRTMVAGIQFNL
jgi:TonB-dependent starch-binding outer membrane protein SusC